MNRIEKLKKLIEEMKDTKEFAWLSSIQVEKASFVVRDKNEVGPAENIRHTYSIRGTINHDRGNPVKGFEAFLKNLDSTKSENLNIHQMVDENGYEYRVFTDPNIEELIGILRLVK